MDKFDIMLAKNKVAAALKVLDAAESNLLTASYGLKFELIVISEPDLTGYRIPPVTFQSDFESLVGRLKAHAFSTEDMYTLMYRGEFRRIDATFKLKCIGDKFNI